MKDLLARAMPKTAWKIQATGRLCSAIAVVALSACGGPSDPQTPTRDTIYSIGGSVAGLAGTGLVLRNNGGNDLAVLQNGVFTFTNSQPSGSLYNVTVVSQPNNPSQTCSVARGVDGVSGGNVTNISVTCTTNSYTISGTVTGLVGSGLVLQNNGGNSIAVPQNSAFTFSASILSGGTYSVTVGTQPSQPKQTCNVANGSGTVTNNNVVNVAIICTTNAYLVGGLVTGLAGDGLILQNNGGGDLTILTDGSFNFLIPLLSGESYAVTTLKQPINVSQTCSVINGVGTIGVASVGTIAVNCVTNKFSVGGTVSGLSGSGLKLRNNGGNDLTIAANGSFVFTATVSSGGAFNVSVLTQPTNPSQTCTIANGAGTVLNGNVANINITCTNNPYTVGGAVTGLAGAGLVLRNNGGDDLPIAASGPFTFATGVASGSNYNVTSFAQPSNPSQTCTPSSNTGTVMNANVTNVAIACTTNRYSIGVTVSGLATGTNLVLQNNGGDNLTVPSDGLATFVTTIASGANFDVRVVRQPANPNQVCEVTNGTGTVTNAAVSVTTIACATQHPRFAFSLDYTSASLSTYAIDETTGQLRRRGFANVGLRPIQIVRDSTQKFLYVLNRSPGSVSAFTHDSVTGENVEVAGSPYLTGADSNLNPNGDGVNSFLQHPTKGFLYVANGSGTGVGANTIAAFRIDAVTGALTSIASYPAGNRPNSINIDALGKFLYVVNSLSNDIYVFSINQTTGALTEVPSGRIATGTFGLLFVLHPNGRFAFVSNLSSNNISVYAVDPATGVLTNVPGSPFATGINPGNGIWLHPNGHFLYVRNAGTFTANDGSISAYAFNESTGFLTPLSGSPYATGINSQYSWMDPARRFLYVVNRGLATSMGLSSSGTISMFKADDTTGVLSPISGSPITLTPAPYSLNVDPSGRFAYVPSAQGSLVSSYSIDQTTGALIPLSAGGTIATRAAPITFDPQSEKLAPQSPVFSSKFAFVANSTDHSLSSFAIDSSTGAISSASSVTAAGALSATPNGTVVHPNGKYLYASDANAVNGISSYPINTTTGALSGFTSSVNTSDGLNTVRIDPNGRTVYANAPNPTVVPMGFQRAYSVAPSTGLLSFLSGVNAANSFTTATDIAVAPTGLYYYFITDSSWGRAPLNAATGEFGGGGGSSGLIPGKSAMTIDPGGRFAYVALSSGGVEVWSIGPPFAPVSGGLSGPTQTAATGSTPKSLTIDPTGRFLYVANSGSNDVSTFSIDQTNGQLTEVPPRVAAGTNPTAISADYSGKYVYVLSGGTNQVLQYSINQTTGALGAILSSAATGNGPTGLSLSTNIQ